MRAGGHLIAYQEAGPSDGPVVILLHVLASDADTWYKAIGQGMQFRFTDFGFSPAGTPSTLNRPDGQPGTGSEWSFRTYTADSDYVVSVAVGDRGFGDTRDTAAQTMLDSGFVEALTEVLGDDDPQDGSEQDLW